MLIKAAVGCGMCMYVCERKRVWDGGGGEGRLVENPRC